MGQWIIISASSLILSLDHRFENALRTGAHSFVSSFIMGNSQSHDVPVRVTDNGNRPSASMTRSRSVRAEAHCMAKLGDENRSEPSYLPRGLDKAHNGIIMPTMPYGIDPTNSTGAGSLDGQDSPQWGWFLRTTPPTPQMYHSRPPTTTTLKHHSTSDSTSSTSTDVSSASTLPGSQPNPVFQGFQDKHKTAPMGWSSVPL